MKGRDTEIWVRPAGRGAEPPSAWREAVVPRVLGVLAVAGIVWVIVLLLLHFRLAGG